jgi:hypothetical protein
MTAAVVTREELKAACLELLDRTAVEHPAGHQGKLAARYVLLSASSERIGMMFEKSPKTRPQLWVELQFAKSLLDADIKFRVYLASSLYRPAEEEGKTSYGRHAALKSMRDLANADLVRFSIDQISQLEIILDRLALR